MNIYKVKKIDDHLILLGEELSSMSINAMALVIGDNKAALIDTGMGATGDLDKYIRQFTDLPVTVLCTHGDPDHIGSCLLFDDVYMNARDEELVEWALDENKRLSDIFDMSQGNHKLYEYAKKHIAKGNKKLNYKKIEDGDTFNLGGIVLEAVAVPGHTKGCICFLNRKDKYALTGDAIVPMIWMWIDRCTSIAEYVEAVKRFKKKAKGIEKMYCGHSLESIPNTTVDDLISAGEEIVAGKISEDEEYTIHLKGIDTSKMKIMQHRYGSVGIIYDKNRV